MYPRKVILLTALAALSAAPPANVQQIYWSDFAVRGIYRANLGGSHFETVVPAATVPTGLALDLVEGRIYWGDYLTPGIWRATLNGSDPSIVFTVGYGKPVRVALDSLHGHVYSSAWYTGSTVWRGKLDGSDVDLADLAVCQQMFKGA